jgi:hypothetical protein
MSCEKACGVGGEENKAAKNKRPDFPLIHGIPSAGFTVLKTVGDNGGKMLDFAEKTNRGSSKSIEAE